MPTEFCFELEDRPGSLAEVAEKLADAGVNIEGGAGVTCQDKCAFCIVTNNPEATASAFQEAGISFTKSEVLMLNMPNAPGQLAKTSRALADAGVNLSSFYITMDQKQVFGVSDIEKAKEVTKSLGLVTT